MKLTPNGHETIFVEEGSFTIKSKKGDRGECITNCKSIQFNDVYITWVDANGKIHYKDYNNRLEVLEVDATKYTPKEQQISIFELLE